MKHAIVKIRKLYKKYTLYHTSSDLLGNLSGRHWQEDFWALRNVNLDIKKGSKIGIWGPNGAGKTTLLKIISGISVPTKGKVNVKGKVVSLMNLEAGFNPELTGVENIYLNGMLIGMEEKYIKSRFDEIVSFAGIGKFIEFPFYTYSSGMKFRLAFSVAIFSECDVLIMDEVLVSGDISFQEKTFNEIKKIQKDNKMTTIICSHIPHLVWSLSSQFYELDGGLLKKMSKNKMRKMVVERSKIWKKTYNL